MKRLICALALGLGITMLTPVAAANATEDWDNDFSLITVQESLRWPMDTNILIIQAPYWSWGLRPVARYINENVKGLRLVYKRGTKCADYSEFACLKVRKIADDNEYKWAYGYYTRAEPFPYDRLIYFNTLTQPVEFTWKKQQTACHELLHALGFAHHDMPGCIGEHRNIYNFPSNRELRVLRGYYNG